MTPLRVGVVVTMILLVVGFLAGIDIRWLAGAGVIVGLLAFLAAREWDYTDEVEFGEVMTTVAPRSLDQAVDSIDISEELADLLKSAAQRAGRLLEDRGALEPFVMYEDVAGNVRVRQVKEPDPVKTLARARRTALEIDETAPRVVVVTAGATDIKGRKRRVVAYEAAERGYRERTMSFVQPYTPRRLVLGARAHGSPLYVGDLPHPLRYARRLATEAPAS